jgi:hypothetical protein
VAEVGPLSPSVRDRREATGGRLWRLLGGESPQEPRSCRGAQEGAELPGEEAARVALLCKVCTMYQKRRVNASPKEYSTNFSVDGVVHKTILEFITFPAPVTETKWGTYRFELAPAPLNFWFSVYIAYFHNHDDFV